MKKKKPGRYLIYAFLCLEIGASLYSFLLGTQGIQQLHTLYAQQKALQVAVSSVRTEIEQVEKSIHQWQHFTFYREQLAREQLQMACADEVVYYIPPA